MSTNAQESGPSKINVALVAGECNRYVKHTGLGDVVRNLGRALNDPNETDIGEVCIVVPRFGAVRDKEKGRSQLRPLTIMPTGCTGWKSTFDEGLPVYLFHTGSALDDLKLDGRDRIDWESDCPTSSRGRFVKRAMAEAMIRFNLLAARWLLDRGPGWVPDVVHCFNWEAALVPTFIRSLSRKRRPPTVLTVDLLTRQGIADADMIPEDCRNLLPTDQLNFMKRGIGSASLLHLPSEQWVDDVCRSPHGCGLEAKLATARNDGRIAVAPFATRPATYDIPRRLKKSGAPRLFVESSSIREQLEWGAREIKDLLGLRPNGGPAFLIGNRLTDDDQKNYAAILAVFPGFLESHPNAQLVLRVLSPPPDDEQGTLRRRLWEELRQLEQQFPARVVVNPPDGYEGYPDINWHLLLIGSDVVMMPSRYEPAGLNHRQGLVGRGCPVIATRKGDMASLVTPSIGWLFDNPEDHGAFRWCLEDATKAFHDPVRWPAMVEAALNTRVGWDEVLPEYKRLYRETQDARRDRFEDLLTAFGQESVIEEIKYEDEDE